MSRGGGEDQHARATLLVEETPRRSFDAALVSTKQWASNSKRRRDSQTTASRRVEEIAADRFNRRIAVGLTQIGLNRRQMDDVLHLFEEIPQLRLTSAYVVDEVVVEASFRVPLAADKLVVRRTNGVATELPISDPVIAIADILFELDDNGINLRAASRYRAPRGGAHCVPIHCNQSLA